MKCDVWGRQASPAQCPSGVECRRLGGACIDCSPSFNHSCVYGKRLNVTCRAKDTAVCTGPREFVRAVRCQYCYQTEKWEHKCELSPNCKSADSPRKYYLTNCTVRSAVVCLGNRVFQKKQLCNWTSGYHWRTTLILSIMLGGFGVDRFYLGYWQEGLGKFFSFGGLGVWTLIDVILIGLHYLGPADGSLYL
ncbi:TM2 domain-containing protein almondex isoform X3 [Bacillus rossius redtenbacheri]|uniref:TM2 domain-containing protein almondex isoform X3 n=1 Tax=Bacillus rossius redtenbacheri TaxID=93214 RepID=UPI002FDE68BB